MIPNLLHLGSVPSDLCGLRHQNSLAKRARWFGEIGSLKLDPANPLKDAMQSVCKEFGFKLCNRSRNGYTLFDYTFSRGSVTLHKDEGMGLCACVLVATAPLSKKDPCSECELIVRGESITLRRGDIFLFNGNKQHAWIANCGWVLAIHTATRSRSQKTRG